MFFVKMRRYSYISRHSFLLNLTVIALSAFFACASGPSSAVAESPVEITIGDAILTALENNRALLVEKLNPEIMKTFEQEERSVFDPDFSAGINATRERVEAESKTTGVMADTTGGIAGANVKISRFLPQGTQVSAGISLERDWSDLYSDRYAARLGLTVSQALLRGAGTDFNLARVRQAELDTLYSKHELRGFTENLVAEVETTYWNYALAMRQLEIYRQSMELAEKQLRETEERIGVGSLAEIELVAAQAEVALRKEALINAESSLETLRLRLLRLLNAPSSVPWSRRIILKNMPAVPDVKLDSVEAHSEVALRMRSDINQARLNMERGNMEIVKTKNGLLPQMDFFISLGKSGYAGSFGRSAQDVWGSSYDVSAGMVFEWPFGNRNAQSRHKRAVLTRRQAEEAFENIANLAELDVRTAYIRVNSASQQIVATAATRKLQEEKVRAETEKFRVGRSTVLSVAQVQRDLVDAQISEVQAVVNYLNSLVDLFRIEGSLLERRGITAEIQ